MPSSYGCLCIWKELETFRVAVSSIPVRTVGRMLGSMKKNAHNPSGHCFLEGSDLMVTAFLHAQEWGSLQTICSNWLLVSNPSMYNYSI